MNRNQRHRRMKVKRRECRLLWGVNRFQQLPPPRSGMECQLRMEQARANAAHLWRIRNGVRDMLRALGEVP